MKKFLTFMTFCIVFAMQSCNSEQEPQIPETEKTEPTISHMVVKFEDKIYETDIVTIGDSVEYLNKDFVEVYRSKIVNHPDIAILMSMDNSNTPYVEYYTSEKELLNSHEFLNINNTDNGTNNYTTRSDTIIVPYPNNGELS